MLPPPLLPMLAIEVAPPAVASLAWFDSHGDHIDTVASFPAGFGALMVLSQVRLLPAFRRLPFMPSTWSFAFARSAVASAAMHWLNDTRPAGYPAEEYLPLIANSVLVIAIAARTVAAACRGRLLPPDLPAGAAPAPPGRQPGTRRPATGKGLRSPWRRI
jgi:tellurite resistance protein